MIGAVLGILNGAVKAWNDWRDAKAREKTENTGKQLQRGADAGAMVKEAQDAARNEDAVKRMPDSQLNDLLR